MLYAGDGIFHIAYQGIKPSKLFFGDTLWPAARNPADMSATGRCYR